jgi:hypothetical protein
MIRRQFYNFVVPTRRRSLERSSVKVILRIYICAMLEQHTCDLDRPVVRTRCYMQRGSALVVLRSYIRPMLE